MKKNPDLKFQPVLASSIVFQADQNAVKCLCTTPYSNHPKGCPNFNQNWSCPPHAPTLEEVQLDLVNFTGFWIIYIEIDIGSNKLLKFIRKRFKLLLKGKDQLQTTYLNHFFDFINERGGGVRVFHASHCTLCKERGLKSCSYPDNPCRFPNAIRYSPEACGIDVFETMKKVGLDLEENPEFQVRRVGLVASSGNLSISTLIEEFE